MPDITMCMGLRDVDDEERSCPRMKTCFRHTATPTPDRQSWFAQAPFWPGGECDYYAPAETSRPEETKR